MKKSGEEATKRTSIWVTFIFSSIESYLNSLYLYLSNSKILIFVPAIRTAFLFLVPTQEHGYQAALTRSTMS